MTTEETTVTDYIVLSPEHQTSYGSELEPAEWGKDVALIVNARNAQEAKWAASRLWDKHHGRWSWSWEARGDGRHPLAEVTVERVPEGEPLGPYGWTPFYADLGDNRE